MSLTVLIVEDDRALREALFDTIELAGFSALQADCGEAAITQIKQRAPDVILSDVNMPGLDGYGLLRYVSEHFAHIPMVLMTAYASVDQAVNAVQLGALDYLVKPVQNNQLIELLQRVGGSNKATDEESPVAEDATSRHVLEMAQKVAKTDSSVLVIGESGTGKEVLARYVHQHSPRSEQPFIAINCAAIPENMLEATLFGHEKGAFTGAISSSPGKFEQANGGTLLLDEISEMDLGLQAKLLRVLQEREVERIGGRKVINLDVRVIATTNRDLRDYVQQGQFREDLYYRLNVFPIGWRPLRERRADILPLAQRALLKHGRKLGKGPISLTAPAKEALLNHDWPGNVRELDNAIQRALILHQGQSISEWDLGLQGEHLWGPMERSLVAEDALEESQELTSDLRRHELQLILEAIESSGGRKKEAAEKLGISPRTLRYKMAKMREMGMLDA